MAPFDPFTVQFWSEIGVALLCGTIIGLERELRGKPTGIRTCILICLGTTLFVRAGAIFAGPHVDPTRVIGQVVTGIGFLGGGVIIGHSEGVKGVTTASVVWLLAAIGVLIGASQFLGAVTISIIAVAVLIGVEKLEQRVKRARHAAGHSTNSPTYD